MATAKKKAPTTEERWLTLDEVRAEINKGAERPIIVKGSELKGRIMKRVSTGSIAYDVGFGDLSYFNRCFRRAYGATPSGVRSGEAL